MTEKDDATSATIKVPIWSLLVPEHAETLERLFRDELEQQKLDALAEFAAGVGHEINNPLAIIGGRAQLLLREISNPEHQKHLASILVQVRRAYEMIADIRLFARPPKPEPSDVSVSDILRDVATRFFDATTEKSIVWDLHNVTAESRPKRPAADDVRIYADAAFLETIFTVLCKNAVEAVGSVSVRCGKQHATPGNTGGIQTKTPGSTEGQIKLSCEYCLAGVRVTIDDNGPGIPPEHLPLIFSPYFSGRQAGRGLGFGLCKAWRLLGLMGGTIKAENRTPNGARFTVTLRNMPQDCCASGID
ncbi:MAG: ATP-binding protein [Planctomycetaceae bacterium]|nr:ATP-binding protein [Planctomycetaceae bacterium]